jgi:uncharacterized protein YjlB
MITPEVFYFKEDGITPNNTLPVIVYRDVLKSDKIKSDTSLKILFESNKWTNNWADIIMTENHYHSTTHEVIGVNKGQVTLKISGKEGRVFTIKSGDVILIPAGVGHFSLSNETSYEAIGGYPNGAEWDVIFDEVDKYGEAIERINQLSIPKTDPVFGVKGYLFKYWN